MALLTALWLLAGSGPTLADDTVFIPNDFKAKVPATATPANPLQGKKTTVLLPPPANLRATADPVVCGKQVKVPLFGAEICEAWIKTGALLLFWSWDPDSSPLTADGFRVYEVPAAPKVAPNELAALSKAGKAAAAAERLRQAKLVAIRDNGNQTIVDVPKPPGGYEGHCYLVTAYARSRESGPSEIYCVRAEQPCTESVDIQKRKRDFQLAAVSEKTIFARGGSVHSVIARLETGELPWKLPLTGPKSIAISGELRPRPDDPEWTADRRKNWFRDQIPLNDPGRGCVTHCAKPPCAVDPLVGIANNADFQANGRIRLVYLHGTNPEIPIEIRGQLERSLLAFRYWITNPGDGTQIGEMNLWSENHVILFATAEYLAGQYFVDQDRQFRGPLERKKTNPALQTLLGKAPEGSVAVDAAVCKVEQCASRRNGVTYFCDGLNGQQHMDRARPRLLRWLDERFRFGFSEWNAPGYYDEDLIALLNLADFVEDRELRTRAAMVLDLLFFDLARLNQKGSFGVAAGRAHGKSKLTGWKQAVGDVVEIAFGTRSRSGECPRLQRGNPLRGCCGSSCWFEDESYSANAFASSRRYCLPKVLAAIGRDQPDHYVERDRVSIDFSEGPSEGINFKTLEDATSWWSRGGIATKQTIKLTCDTVNGLKLWKSDPFKGELADYGLCGGGTGSEVPEAARRFIADNKEGVVDLLSPVVEGLALTRANLQVYRNRDVMLSSVQAWRKGQTGHQSNPWQATFDANATVFTSFPAAKDPRDDSVNWWNGNAVNPMVIQHENAAIIAYSMPYIGIQHVLYGPRTHAWFPRYAFDESFSRPSQGCSCTVETDKLADAALGPAGGKRFVKGCKRGGIIGFILAGPLGVIPGCATQATLEVSVGALAEAADLGRSCACQQGKWFFGRRGEGYIGLFAAQSGCQWRPEGGLWEDEAKSLIVPRSKNPENEIFCDEEERNVFIAQVGNRQEFGSFQTFVDKVVKARIHLHALNAKPTLAKLEPEALQCSYDIPAGNLAPGKGHRLQLLYGEKKGALAGIPFDLDSIYADRFDNPYAQTRWGDRVISIRHGGQQLSLTRDARKWGRYGTGISQ